MPAAHRRRRPDWAHQLPAELREAMGPSHPGLNAYAGLQQRYCPEAEGRARALVARGFGALEPWLSAVPEVTLPDLFAAVARGGVNGRDACALWRQQQGNQQPPRAGRRRSVERIDWGDAEADQVA